MLDSEIISRIRMLVFGITGALCLLYAVMSFVTGHPEPFPFWIPGVSGMIAFLVLWGTSFAAGTKHADMAWDEGYAADARRAAGLAFWVGIFLYPLFGLLLSQGVVDWPVAFAVMGTLTPAAYLLLLVSFDRQGRT